MLYKSNPKIITAAADESSSDDLRDDLFLLLFGDLTTSLSDEAPSMDLTLSNDDSILGGTIFDSLTLKRNEAMRRNIIKDEEEEEDDVNVMDDKNDAAIEAPQDQAISTPSSCHRRGVRRGHQDQDSFDSTSFSSATTFTVMTKTHDGSSRSSSIISDLSTSLHSTLSKSSTTARAA